MKKFCPKPYEHTIITIIWTNNNKKTKYNKKQNQHAFLITLLSTLLLLSFLAFSSVNSQIPVDYPFEVIATNETPSTASARCYIHGIETRDEIIMTPDHYAEFIWSIIPGGDYTLSCDVKLGEKHGFSSCLT